jgi:hypothetical protein
MSRVAKAQDETKVREAMHKEKGKYGVVIKIGPRKKCPMRPVSI